MNVAVSSKFPPHGSDPIRSRRNPDESIAMAQNIRRLGIDFNFQQRPPIDSFLAIVHVCGNRETFETIRLSPILFLFASVTIS